MPISSRTREKTSLAAVRDRLEAVAERAFADRGYAATTIDEIVAAAGVSKPAFYRHFESKKALHMALLERHRDQLAAAALAHVESRKADVEAMIDAWFAYVQSHPYTWRLLFRDTTHDPDVEALHRELQRRQRDADVALLRRLPHIPAAELEPLGELIRSSLTGLALWWLEHPETPRAVLVSAMLRVLRGIGSK